MTEDKLNELTKRLDSLEEDLDTLRNKWEYFTFGETLNNMIYNVNSSFSYNYPIYISDIEICMYMKDTLNIIASYPDDNKEDYEKIIEDYFNRNYDIDVNIIKEDN